MRRARIQALGQVSSCGCGVAALREALGGRRPDPTWTPLRAHAVAPVPTLLASAEGLAQWVDPRVLRRLDSFCQRFLLAALAALRDSQHEVKDPLRTGVVVATGYGPLVTSFAFLDGVIDQGDDLGSPFLFSFSVHNAPASNVSCVLGLQGPCLTVTGFAHAWARALEVAFEWLDEGLVDEVFVGAGDEYHGSIGYGVRRLADTPQDGLVRPLDFGRCTYVAGETFVVVLLGREDAVGPSWGLVDRPVFFDREWPSRGAAEEGPVFLAARGEADSGPAYARVARRAGALGAYTTLWGSNPTCDAMVTATAAVSIADQALFDVPLRPALDVDRLVVGGPARLEAIHCISHDLPDEGVAITVRRDPVSG